MKPLDFKKIIFKDTMGKSKEPIPLILKHRSFPCFYSWKKNHISFEHLKLILAWTRF